MEPRRLGRSGLIVPPLALGTAAFGDRERIPWSVDAEAVWPLIRTAYEQGITLFDTGSTYGGGLAEERLGAAIERLDDRHGVTVITKIYFPTGPGPQDRGLSRRHLVAALDRSLRRLRTDYVDVLMIHRFDRDCPIEETLDTLDGFVRCGQVRYLGASSMSAWRLMKMLGVQRERGLVPFSVMQGYYNPLYREEEREMIPLCKEEGLGYLAWSPLARGRLAGEHADSARLRQDPLAAAGHCAELDDPVLAALDRAAAASGRSHVELALGWLAHRGAIPVIGATSPSQLAQARAAVTELPDKWCFSEVDAAYRPHAVIGFDPRDEQPGDEKSASRPPPAQRRNQKSDPLQR